MRPDLGDSRSGQRRATSLQVVDCRRRSRATHDRIEADATPRAVWNDTTIQIRDLAEDVGPTERRQFVRKRLVHMSPVDWAPTGTVVRRCSVGRTLQIVECSAWGNKVDGEVVDVL